MIAVEELKIYGFISAISRAVARVGVILIGLYLIQILLGLTRYNFRLADHLLISAETLEFCSEDLDKLTTLMGVISTNHIDFGKAPTTPIDKIIDAIKDSINRQKSG